MSRFRIAFIAAAAAFALFATFQLAKSSESGFDVEESAALSLQGIPYLWSVPQSLQNQLKAEFLSSSKDDFARSIYDADGRATTVYFQPFGSESNPSILATFFWFPEKAFEANINPNEPPKFGTEVLRRDGYVFAVAGPTDAMYSDEKNAAAIDFLYKSMYLAESFIFNEESAKVDETYGFADTPLGDTDSKALVERICGELMSAKATEAQAQFAAEQSALIFRVTAREGEYFAVTKDYRINRLNVEISSGKVAKCTQG